MNILIADSGSTKTEWLIAVVDEVSDAFESRSFRTSGLNPCLMGDDEIRKILLEEVAPQLEDLHFARLSFYGAGCTPAQTERMSGLLRQYVATNDVDVASDLYGAARLLCRNTEGIVAILGTGSGSGLFDGERFVRQTPSMGFILGDEGSGAVLGKNFLGNLYKGQFPEDVTAKAMAILGHDLPTIIEHVYRKPCPNRYLASYTHCIKRLEQEESVRVFLRNNFESFFRRNILSYGRPELPVHFVGSVAAVFEQPLREAAALCNCRIGDIVQSPLSRVDRSLFVKK